MHGGYAFGMDSLTWKGWGLRLKKHMRDAKITQEEVGAKMETSQGGVAHWLSGRREINLTDFFTLCAAAQASPREILFGVDNNAAIVEGLKATLAEHPELMRHIAQPAVSDARVAESLEARKPQKKSRTRTTRKE